MGLVPATLVRVKDFMTYKVFDASSGRWELVEEASGPDLTDMIAVWQQKTKADIKRAEAARAEPYREGDTRYRVIITTFVYYMPATEGTDDPTAKTGGDTAGHALSGMAE
jgi:hypothetical protein